jgi:hypothetical protein
MTRPALLLGYLFAAAWAGTGAGSEPLLDPPATDRARAAHQRL